MLFSDSSKILIGTQRVSKIYLGNTVVYQLAQESEGTTYVPGEQAPNSTVTYLESPGQPTVKTDSTGAVVSYKMNESTALPSNGIDTGIIAFNGRPFTINLKATFDTSVESGHYIVSALQKTSGSNYAGFAAQVNSTTRFALYGSTSSPVRSSWWGSSLYSSGWTYTRAGSKTYTFKITYTPASSGGTIEMVATPLYTTSSGTTTRTAAASTHTYTGDNLPTSLTEATITLGSLGIEHTHDATNMTILGFNVEKE